MFFVLLNRLSDFFLEDRLGLNVCLMGNEMKVQLRDIKNEYFLAPNEASTDDEPIMVYDKLTPVKFRMVSITQGRIDGFNYATAIQYSTL